MQTAPSASPPAGLEWSEYVDWLVSTQRTDGAWHQYYIGDGVEQGVHEDLQGG